MKNPLERTEHKLLQGNALAEAMIADKQFIADTIKGMQQIEAGDNTTITIEELKESLQSGQPITFL